MPAAPSPTATKIVPVRSKRGTSGPSDVAAVGLPRHRLLALGAELSIAHTPSGRCATVVRRAGAEHATSMRIKPDALALAGTKGTAGVRSDPLCGSDPCAQSRRSRGKYVVCWPTAQTAATSAAAGRSGCRRTWSGAPAGGNGIVRRGAAAALRLRDEREARRAFSRLANRPLPRPPAAAATTGAAERRDGKPRQARRCGDQPARAGPRAVRGRRNRRVVDARHPSRRW